MKQKILLLSIFFTLLAPTLAKTQNVAFRADELLTAYYNQDLFIGTVIIAKKGEVVFEKSYGMANSEVAIANTSNTQFRIGSILKPITTMIIMQLNQKRFIELKRAVK